ncbi:hypothetical protein A2767_07575 [Candidatus Roizmanbacteria bacterium RIFCSPHIGHO2_01_FULL_35_10]|uniref:Penicillin-binding protein 2 n=1 Tax=Candidatus Roizmanbacteria bacterium RIFCSPLOWO2_01_FULL_35_13 TaxID=1802055 RepID=A0A1F7ICN8_9BACT|nr:MAG: hypothetical protein A2767_07575 [Candidatus Roizmanbacteria bacterium RIFCSPHIGHO2_01_FULL_35_10]OGK41127.1 MAG: hypothetical protein A3A74_02175 [Candidatus Roizmanbacteria bacterium RIFCSPLOWO2_01_FULL_35_13]
MNKLPYFSRGESRQIHFEERKRFSAQTFLYLYICLLVILFFGLILRLFQLTIVKGSYYRQLSEQNRIREILIEPKRGKIIDRKGLTIAENKEADIDEKTERLTSSRIYNEAEAIAHILGYRQKADKNDFKDGACVNKLKTGDKIGKKGVEKLFDCQLRGKYGKKLIEVDAKGSNLRTLSLFPPVDGETIQLALDLELQNIAYGLIKDKKATIIATKPQTGEVLILASSPSFNPQDFEDENANTTALYLKSKEKPMFNRATEGTYAPGSVFKLILAAGALEEKKIDEKFTVEDTGILKAGPLEFGNWYFLQYGKTDGTVDIVKALRRSNDIFFYKIGDLLTPTKIKKWAEIFGYGAKTNIGFEEAEGLVPSAFWKKEVIKDRWYLGDTYNLSIGQGYLLVTPLQVNQVTSVFANDGNLCKPQLLKYQISDIKYQNCKKLPISQKTLDLVRQGMKEACTSGGTGWPFFQFSVTSSQSSVNTKSSDSKLTTENRPLTTDIRVGCKTGTAESHGKDTLPHAWFTVFAPFDKPEIALTVLLEEAGQGSDVAAPIAKEILKIYFERKE